MSFFFQDDGELKDRSQIFFHKKEKRKSSRKRNMCPQLYVKAFY